MANRLGVWPTTVIHHSGGRREGLLTLLIEHLAAGICTWEAADLIYHLSVLLLSQGVEAAEVLEVLNGRRV